MKTNELIFQKTWGLLLAKGYDGVSISDIQQVTGMARGLLYHYFDNQEGLFREVTEHYLSCWLRDEKGEVKDKSIPELIGYFTEKYQRLGLEMQEYGGDRFSMANIWLLFLEIGRYQPALAGFYQELCSGRCAIWKMAVLNSFGRGELKSGLNLESIARYFVYMQDSIVLNTRVEESWHEISYALEKGLREFFEIIRR